MLDPKIDSALESLEATAGAAERMSDQINAAIAENRPGAKDFTERGLPELQGLIQDMTRLIMKCMAP